MPEITEEEFPGNSNKEKAMEVKVSPKRVKRVVKGHAVKRKKSSGSSFFQSFLGEDAKNVGMYILQEVLLPAAKSTIQDVITNGIEMLLYGETSGRRRSGGDRSRQGSIVSYDRYYNRDDDRRSRRSEPPRSRYHRYHGLEEVIIEDRGEAQDTLRALDEALDKYDSVTVADLYELAGFDGGDWTDTKWGWKDLRRANITKVRGGWALDLPDPIPLD